MFDCSFCRCLVMLPVMPHFFECFNFFDEQMMISDSYLPKCSADPGSTPDFLNQLHNLTVWGKENKQTFVHKSLQGHLFLDCYRPGIFSRPLSEFGGVPSNMAPFWCGTTLMFQTAVNKLALSMWGEMIKDWEFSLDVSVPAMSQPPAGGGIEPQKCTCSLWL